MQKLHEEMALPMAEKSLSGSYFKDLLLVAFDGSTLALQDAAANAEEFGRSSNQNGDSAWIRCCIRGDFEKPSAFTQALRNDIPKSIHRRGFRRRQRSCDRCEDGSDHAGA